ncbi:membrane dipeptidase [Streptomyces canus]|uniref:membrane dipeptidase n=1 Tax=Streptomyces canus TaxID=58343 RepID=UPI000D14EB54
MCPSPRNVTDEFLQLLPDNGGVIQRTFVPYFVSAKSPSGYRSWTALSYPAASAPRSIRSRRVSASHGGGRGGVQGHGAGRDGAGLTSGR